MTVLYTVGLLNTAVYRPAVLIRRPFVERFTLCYRTVVLSVTLVYCDQTLGMIKMKLCMEAGLGPGHIVLGKDPAPLPQRGIAPPPNFRPAVLQYFLRWYLIV